MTVAPQLTNYDWTVYTCQCTHPHHPPGGCTDAAKYVLALHAVNHCNDPGLDPFGNHVEIRCTECTAKAWRDIRTRLRNINHALRGRQAQCDTCGAPISEVADVLRSIEGLS